MSELSPFLALLRLLLLRLLLLRLRLLLLALFRQRLSQWLMRWYPSATEDRLRSSRSGYLLAYRVEQRDNTAASQEDVERPPGTATVR